MERSRAYAVCGMVNITKKDARCDDLLPVHAISLNPLQERDVNLPEGQTLCLVKQDLNFEIKKLVDQGRKEEREARMKLEERILDESNARKKLEERILDESNARKKLEERVKELTKLEERVKELELHNPDLYFSKVGVSRTLVAYGILELIRELILDKAVQDFIKKTGDHSFFQEVGKLIKADPFQATYARVLRAFFNSDGQQTLDKVLSNGDGQKALDKVLSAAEGALKKKALDFGICMEEVPSEDFRKAFRACNSQQRHNRNVGCHFLTSGDNATRKKVIKDLSDALDTGCLKDGYEELEALMRLGIKLYYTEDAKKWINSRRVQHKVD